MRYLRRCLVFLVVPLLLDVPVAQGGTKEEEKAAKKAARAQARKIRKEAEAKAEKLIKDSDAEGLKAHLTEFPDLVNWVDRARTPLANKVAMSDCVDCMKVMIELKADMMAFDLVKRMPIHVAAGSSTLEMVQLLVESGEDPGKKSEWGETPLSFARRNFYMGKYDERVKITRWLMKEVSARAAASKPDPTPEPAPTPDE